ncbi:MAG TPA: hypothetical protein VD833_08765 [Vicinamibacterales bacterium]|nr:hypothetical protein [Vicinamibacterales bacterium]
MPHPLVLALFPSPAAAAAAARSAHALGVTREQLSVVARSHDEEGALAAQMDATPGADIEDSRVAGRLGELSGHVLAAIAIVMPGIGPIVTAGPLAAGLGEAAGHAAGGVASILRDAGVPPPDSEALEREVENGAVLLGIHCTPATADQLRSTLAESGASRVIVATWRT